MKCNNCKFENEKDSNFCLKCGNKLKNDEYICTNCKNVLNENDNYCIKCGTKKEMVKDNQKQNISFEKILNKAKELGKKIINKTKEFAIEHKKSCIVGLVGFLFIIAGIILYKPISDKHYKENIHYSFKVNGEEFKIGEKVSYYEKKGYTYKDEYYKDSNFIVEDGFIPHAFYKDKTPVMYAALHCKQEKKCNYSNSNVVKINFYESIGEVVLADFIKIGTTYDEIVSKLGKQDGKFYMNDAEYVWSFYEKGKINNPYYVLEFDYLKKVVGIKIGIWWYEGEYEHTIKK